MRFRATASIALIAASTLLAVVAAQAEDGWRHGTSIIGEMKYPETFTHFDYVNPDAPKGGIARLEASGRYDTFNFFNVKGSPATPGALTIETLMTPSLDEGSTHYGLMAEWMERAPDDSWVAFRLRDAARWHDGEPVTVADVKKSFELLTT